MLLQYSTTVVSAGTTDNKTLGNLTFCTKWKHETGLVFSIYDVVKHIIVQDYYMNLRCTAQKHFPSFQFKSQCLLQLYAKLFTSWSLIMINSMQNVLNIKTMKIIWEKNIFNNN